MSAFVPNPLAARHLSSSYALSSTTPHLRQHARGLAVDTVHSASNMRVAAPPLAVPASGAKRPMSMPTIPSATAYPPQLTKPPSRRERAPPAGNEDIIVDGRSDIRELLDAGDYDGARVAFTALAHATSDRSDVLRSWAFMEAMHGDDASARALFARAVRAADSPPVEAAAWNAWGLSEQRKGHTSTARKCFVNGLKADPTHAPLCQAFAVFEAKYGLKRRARELFARCAQLSKTSRTWIAWANFEADEDNVQKARILYRNAVEAAIDDEGVAAILSFARFEERRKQFGRARELYRDGTVRFGKNCAKLLHAWGVMESHAGRYIQARRLFLSTLDCPGLSGHAAAPTYQAWALAEKRAGNIASARKLFARGAEADPKHAYIWQAWGIMESKLRNHEAAREYFRKGTEAQPNSAPTWNAWAKMEAVLGDYEAARKLYRKATVANETHARSWQAWACMEGKLGNLDTARSLFKKIVAFYPGCAPAWQAWARMEENVGNFEVARELYQKGVDADPAHIAVWQAWSQMEERVSDGTFGPTCTLPSPAEL